jgi:hypothetical protein
MITLLPLRIDTAAPPDRLLDQALAAAMARTTEKLAASRRQPTLDAILPVPIVTTIRTGS